MFQGRPDGLLVAMDDMVATNAMAPQNLLIPVGTTVTFVNPADNANAHGAVSVRSSRRARARSLLSR